MSDSPDAIRADIERTRQELGGDVDALADKVTPSKIMDRQTDKLKGAFGSMRDKVMGSADDVGTAVTDAGSAAVHGAEDVKDRVVAKAEGNPLAVGLIAFGAGLLIASLIPASRKEKEVAADVKEKAQPLLEEAGEVAKEVGEHLRQPAQDAVEAVKESATESFETVQEEAQAATAEVADQAQQSRERIADL
jgi:ElaB/YqjD/DUF883 family membrane-anchored ribosome-binding protein